MDRGARVFGHEPQAPVRCLCRDLLRGQRQGLLHLLLRKLAWLAWAGHVVQTGQTLFLVSSAPFEYHRGREAQAIADPGRRQRRVQILQNPSPLRQALAQRAFSKPSLQL